MHVSEPSLPSADGLDNRAWWRGLNSYQWFVLIVAILGWLFDTMDQQLFNIARSGAIADLHGWGKPQFWAGLSTSIFMIGWATGGIIFGVLGDRYGRAKTMTLTIMLYSVFTGLSALSYGFWDFAFYRFLTGLGVGGEFAVGVTLVAEVMPQRARSHALAWLQACSAIGNISAAFVGMALSQFSDSDAWTRVFGEMKAWRVMFIVGAVPALLALFLFRRLREPEAWTQMRANRDIKLGSFAELFGDARWRRNALGGVLLATSGVVGLWGIGFFGFDLVTAIFRQTFETESIAKGESVMDRQALQHLVTRREASEQVGQGKTFTTANQFVSPEAKYAFKGILELKGKEKDAPISAASVLSWSEENQDPGGNPALTPQKIQEYLTPSETPLAEWSRNYVADIGSEARRYRAASSVVGRHVRFVFQLRGFSGNPFLSASCPGNGPARLCRLLRRRDVRDGFGVLVLEDEGGYLLDGAHHGFFPAFHFRRLCHLFSGVVPDSSA